MAKTTEQTSETDRSTACPVCGSGDGAFSRRREGFAIHKCRACGSDWAVLTRAQLPSYNEHYEDESNYVGYHNMLATVQSGKAALYWYQPRMLAEAGEGRGRLHIDLGSGLGTFLASSRKQGWQSLGVDISASAAATAKQALGIDTHVGDLLDLPRPSEPVGWVSAFEVLEHVYDPRAYVRFIHDLLEPGGLVTVSVPNGRSRQEKFTTNPILIPPTHINFYSRTGLRRMFETAGFETLYDYVKPIAWGEITKPKWVKALMLPLLVADRLIFGHTGNRLLWAGRKRG